MTKTITLTSEQLKALSEFAADYKRGWKSNLNHAWMTGRYDCDADISELQTIRNVFGPSWLVRFRINNPKTHSVKL